MVKMRYQTQNPNLLIILEWDHEINKDMLLELTDIGLMTVVGYTPMTLVYREKTPKIMAEVQGDSLLCSYNEYTTHFTFSST